MRLSAPVKGGLWGLALVTVALLKYGVGVFPAGWVLVDIAGSWSAPGQAEGVGPGTSYLLSNAWTAITFGALGITTSGGFLAASLGLVVVALLLPFLLPSIGGQPDRAAFAFVLLAASAVPLVLLQWVGSYDALTAIAAALAVLARSRWIAVLGWVLLGLNHSSLAVVALVVWFTTTWLLDRQPNRARLVSLAWAGGATAVGSVTTWLLVRLWGGGTSRLEWFQGFGPDAFAALLRVSWPYLLWSILGVGWVLLAREGLIGSRRILGVLLVAAIATIAVSLLAFDGTRVAALAVLPALLAVARYAPLPSRRSLIAFGALAVALPTVMVMSGAATLVGWGLDVTLPRLG